MLVAANGAWSLQQRRGAAEVWTDFCHFHARGLQPTLTQVTSHEDIYQTGGDTEGFLVHLKHLQQNSTTPGNTLRCKVSGAHQLVIVGFSLPRFSLYEPEPADKTLG